MKTRLFFVVFSSSSSAEAVGLAILASSVQDSNENRSYSVVCVFVNQ